YSHVWTQIGNILSEAIKYSTNKIKIQYSLYVDKATKTRQRSFELSYRRIQRIVRSRRRRTGEGGERMRRRKLVIKHVGLWSNYYKEQFECEAIEDTEIIHAHTVELNTEPRDSLDVEMAIDKLRNAPRLFALVRGVMEMRAGVKLMMNCKLKRRKGRRKSKRGLQDRITTQIFSTDVFITITKSHSQPRIELGDRLGMEVRAIKSLLRQPVEQSNGNRVVPVLGQSDLGLYELIVVHCTKFRHVAMIPISVTFALNIIDHWTRCNSKMASDQEKRRDDYPDRGQKFANGQYKNKTVDVFLTTILSGDEANLRRKE
ncbi:hypothetical protein C0J52_26650, partial [Blattella germanica]